MRRRRDPRAEWLSRRVAGRERPRFALGAIVLKHGRERRDPRARRDAATVMPGERPRIDWKAEAKAEGVRRSRGHPGAAASRWQEPTAVIIDEPAFLALAVLDHPGGALSGHDREVVAAARELAGEQGAVVALTIGAIDGLAEAGADRVMSFPGDPDGDPESRAAEIFAVAEALRPRHMLFAETAEGGGDMARRVAARLGERLLSGVEELPGGVAARRIGAATQMRVRAPRLMSIAAGAFAAHHGAPHEARPLGSPRLAPAVPALRVLPLPVDPDAIPLAEADFLLSAGNGVTDWAGFAELAAALGRNGRISEA